MPTTSPTPDNVQAAFTHKKHRPQIICFGDSHTQGIMGVCWVDIMQEKFPQFKFIKCGISGEVLESIQVRVEPALKSHHDVVGCIVLGGTNDCLAHLNPSTRNLAKFFNPWLKDFAPLDEYKTTLSRIFGTIHQHFPRAHIASITLPIMGENMASAENLLVDQVSEMIVSTAAAYGRNIQVFDLNNRMKRYMTDTHPDKPPATFQPDFTTMFTATTVSVVKGLVNSWDAIGDARGLTLSTDGVHLNNRAGKLLTEMLSVWVEALQEEILHEQHYTSLSSAGHHHHHHHPHRHHEHRRHSSTEPHHRRHSSVEVLKEEEKTKEGVVALQA